MKHLFVNKTKIFSLFLQGNPLKGVNVKPDPGDLFFKEKKETHVKLLYRAITVKRTLTELLRCLFTKSKDLHSSSQDLEGFFS